MTALATVMLAMNDPDNGLPMGRAVALEVGLPDGREWKLEAAWPGPICKVVKEPVPRSRYLTEVGRLRLGRHTYRIRHHATWVGSWCWDHFTTSVPDAERLLRNALASDWWSVMEEPVEALGV